MEVQVVDSMTALPGKCFYCGTADPERGPWLDTGINLDWQNNGEEIVPFGVVYFCTQCMQFIGDKMGYIPPHLADELKLQVLTTQSENLALQERVNELQEALLSLTKVGFSGSNSNPQSASYSDSVDVSHLEAESQLPFGEEGVESGTNGSSEQDSVSELADLRSDVNEPNPFDL